MRLAKLGGLTVRVVGGVDGDGAGDGPVVVLLHGFGAPGDDLVPLGRALSMSPDVAPLHARLVLPEAPMDLGPRYLGGRAWWWIDLDARMRREAQGKRDIAEVPEGLDAARALVDAALDEAQSAFGAPPARLVLGGFSQGAMLALDVALRSSRPLGGLVLLSGTHIAAREWEPRIAARDGLPIFMSHGQDDPILPFSVAEGLRDTLRAGGMAVDWAPFRGGHGIPPSVLERACAFLGRVLA